MTVSVGEEERHNKGANLNNNERLNIYAEFTKTAT